MQRNGAAQRHAWRSLAHVPTPVRSGVTAASLSVAYGPLAARGTPSLGTRDAPLTHILQKKSSSWGRGRCKKRPGARLTFLKGADAASGTPPGGVCTAIQRLKERPRP